MYIDSNDIKAIGSFLKSGFLKGVTTNPTILSTGSGSRFKQLQDLLALEPTANKTGTVNAGYPQLLLLHTVDAQPVDCFQLV